jgi:hypothetical protein
MRTLVGAALVALLLAGCAAQPRPTVADAESVLVGRGANASYAFGPTTIAEALPSAHYVNAATGIDGTVSQLVVTGRFTAWHPGVAMVWPTGTGGDTGDQVPWDSSKAETRTVVLTFAVDSVVAAADGVTASRQVSIEFTVYRGTRPDTFARGLVSGGRMVLFLVPPSNPADRGLWTVPFDGAFLGTVDAAGMVTMGVLDADPGWANVAATARGITVADLEEAGRTSRTIPVGG